MKFILFSTCEYTRYFVYSKGTSLDFVEQLLVGVGFCKSFGIDSLFSNIFYLCNVNDKN